VAVSGSATRNGHFVFRHLNPTARTENSVKQHGQVMVRGFSMRLLE